MYDHYLTQELDRMHRQEALARAEHERMLVANGLDLYSVVRRALAQRLARVHLPSVRLPRVSLFTRPAARELHLVSRAQLDRRMDHAA